MPLNMQKSLKIMRIFLLLLAFFLPTYSFADPLVKHYIAEEGAPFPTPKPFETPPYKPQIDAAVMAQIKKLQERVYPTPTIYEVTPLKNCTKNRGGTDKREGMTAGEGLDLLFIDPSQIPPEAEVVLGDTVRIVPYTKEVSLGTELAKEFDVTCLPTRLRFLEGAMYRYEGENALRNFTKDIKNGEVHPFLKTLRRKK